MTTYTKEDLEERYIKARSNFQHYLETNKNRKTPERFAILEEIYLNQHHFDAEALYIKMKQNAYRVSRATIYNTLDILVECGLIKAHQFGINKTLFERSYGFEDHDHLICTSCGKIVEFQDTRLNTTVSDQCEASEFTKEHYALNIYGKCESCKVESKPNQ